MIPNLRPPTACLSESAALDRLAELKGRGQLKPSITVPAPTGPEFREFAADWVRMMVRENS